jgi:hypothetical protein
MKKLVLFLRNLLLPAFIHFLIVGAFSTIDPCNNNPGCMAGSSTFYFLLLITTPVMLVLFVGSIIQLMIEEPNYSKYLIINLGIALIPIPLVAGIIYGIRTFT